MADTRRFYRLMFGEFDCQRLALDYQHEDTKLGLEISHRFIYCRPNTHHIEMTFSFTFVVRQISFLRQAA
jgi:hypothetical protein